VDISVSPKGRLDILTWPASVAIALQQTGMTNHTPLKLPSTARAAAPVSASPADTWRDVSEPDPFQFLRDLIKWAYLLLLALIITAVAIRVWFWLRERREKSGI
jgi:hypothetical protein